MENIKNSPSFGRFLRTRRLEKGVNLEVISRETKIRMDVLLLIEQEDHNRLPAEVFVKGFLRAYAKVIGVDEDDVIRRYLSSLQVFKESARSEDDLIRLNKNYWPRLLLPIGALLCIIAFSVYVVSFFQGRPSTPAPKSEQFRQQKEVVEDIKEIVEDIHDRTSEPPEVSSPIEKHSEVISEKLLLKIMALEVTWIKVIIDEKDPKEYVMHPGDHLEFEASSDFNLRIGNAGGVKLTLNDESLGVLGKSGQVVNVQLP
jgi:cytoskeletal protein RodZ